MSKAPQVVSGRPASSSSRTHKPSSTVPTAGRKKVVVEIDEIDGSDAMGDALATLGLRGRVFCRSELAPPWALRVAPGEYAHFHLMVEGCGWLYAAHHDSPVSLAAGDLIVLPGGKGHLLSHGRDPQPQYVTRLPDEKAHGGGIALIRSGAGNPTTRMICGSFQARRREGTSLLLQLPPVLHLKAREGQLPDWLASIIKLLTGEAIQPRLGRNAVMSHLTDVLLICVLRYWLERSPDQQRWLVALKDSRIGAALSHIRKNLGRAWTVDELAKRAAMSRSAFAARFTALLGEAPLHYIARWRMLRAADLLRNSKISIAEIASELGYATTAAFHKAFRRHFRTTPGTYRRRS